MSWGLPLAGQKLASLMRADWMEADSPPHAPRASHWVLERWPAARWPVVRSPVVRWPVVRSPESAVTESAVTESAVTESAVTESGLKVRAVARDEAKSGAPWARNFEEGGSPAVRSPLVRSPKADVMLGALTIPLAAVSASS